MNGPLPDAYWQELGDALRAMLGFTVVLAAAAGAALTLTGAARPERLPASTLQPCHCSAPANLPPDHSL